MPFDSKRSIGGYVANFDQKGRLDMLEMSANENNALVCHLNKRGEVYEALTLSDKLSLSSDNLNNYYLYQGAQPQLYMIDKKHRLSYYGILDNKFQRLNKNPMNVVCTLDGGLLCADFDGDTHVDYVTVSVKKNKKKAVYMTTGYGKADAAAGAIVDLKDRYSGNFIAEDFNNDGLLDFMYLNGSSKSRPYRAFMCFRKAAEE